MTGATASEMTSMEGETPCEVGECASCGATVLVTDPDGTDSLERYGPRETCECEENEFHRVSVDEALN